MLSKEDTPLSNQNKALIRKIRPIRAIISPRVILNIRLNSPLIGPLITLYRKTLKSEKNENFTTRTPMFSNL